MIDPIIFATEWTILEERFNRNFNQVTQDRFYDMLSEELTTEQFAHACKQIFRHSRFFPTPQEFVDFGKDSPKYALEAAEEFDRALERAQRGELATQPNTLTRQLMNLVTFGVPLGQVDSKSLPFMRKDFITRYSSAKAGSTSALELPSSQVYELPDGDDV